MSRPSAPDPGTGNEKPTATVENASGDSESGSIHNQGPQLAPESHHTLNVIPTLPYVLHIGGLPPDTSHNELRQNVHSHLPSKDVSDDVRFHILDLSNGNATVEFACPNLAQAVASALNGLDFHGSTLECSMMDNTALVSGPESDSSATPTPPPPMGSVNPFFYMPSVYPMDYGYFGPQVPPNMVSGTPLYSYPTAPTSMPSGPPVAQHPGMHYVHSVPNMVSLTGIPAYPQNPPYGHTPYGFYSVPDTAGMNYGYGSGGAGAGYGSSHNSLRRSLTKLTSNFSRTRSSRTSSLSLNRQNSANSFRRGSNGSRNSSLSGPARTSLSLSFDHLAPGKILQHEGRFGESAVPEAPESEEAEREDDGEFDEDGMTTVEDENGQQIKVNPTRLFVGNIPFSSTWPALKNFLITKAEEFEPGNDIEILKVEIPMQQARGGGETSNVGPYYYLSTLSQQRQNTPGGHMAHGPGPPHNIDISSSRQLSRGFAIVTTGNKASLEKLIKYFNNVEFENRPMTVRFDRFPNFNKYTLQQLYPSGRKSSYSGGAKSKPSFITNLAFERNSFQQNYYYGCAPQFHAIALPFLGSPMYPPGRMFPNNRVRGTRAASELANSGTEDEIERFRENLGHNTFDSGGPQRDSNSSRMSMADLGPPLQEIQQSILRVQHLNEEDAVTARELVDFVGDASQ